jgi:uncharacterized protein (DUF305 family)
VHPIISKIHPGRPAVRGVRQAAVEMSKLVIAGTKDAEITKLAQEIITAQEKEITVIDAWLKKKA